MRSRLVNAPVLALALLAGSQQARAGEQEWTVEGAAEAAMLRAWGATWWGPGAAIRAAYGLSDSWTLRAGVGYEALFAPDGPVRPLHVIGANLDILWTFDVLRVVPYLFLGVGAAGLGGQEVDWRAELELSAGVGAWYLLSRTWRVGGELRYGFMVPDTPDLPAGLLLSFLFSYCFF